MQEKQKPCEPENEENTRADDQQKRSYYYDDSHGYEVFDPETENDEEDED